MNLIYVADDDKNICDLLITHLENNGYSVKGYSNAKDLLEDFKKKPCDLIVTDIMMPQMGGYELCREVRQISQVPFIMISANNDEIDRVLGLELGGDDYIGKPISFRELVIKVKNLLRRNVISSMKDDKILVCKDLSIKLISHSVHINEVELAVTPKEFELLCLLVKNVNRVYTREQIVQIVWDYNYMGDDRQVDHLIKRLRKKMLEAGAECQIKTVWGVGYKISDE